MSATAAATDFARFASQEERRIARQLLAAIFSEPGRSVTVSNGGDETTGLILRESGVYRHLASTGSDVVTIYERGEQIGWVWLVWGNGEDLISDYSDNEATSAFVEPLLD